MTDEQYAIRAAGGDELAFRTLASRLQPMLVRVARRRWAPGLDHADYDQEALVALYEACSIYQPQIGTPFRRFAELIVQRHLDELTKRETRLKRRLHVIAASLDAPVTDTEDASTLHDLVAARSLSPTDEAIQGETVRLLIETITASLTPLERETLIGWAFLGESYSEIEARILAFDGDRPGRAAYTEVKVVDNAMTRARCKLRRALAEEAA